jgi:serine/threonine protein kinase
MKRIKGYKIDDERGIIYSLGEFCPEGNLQQFLDRYDLLTEEDVLLIFGRIVHSVLAIHNNGYIHADLKLENISMCGDTIPKIRTFKTRVVKDSINSKRGTPLYMPPEALLDLFQPSRFFFQKSFDNYALGVILYFMLHYKFPFYGNTYEELVINMSNRKVLVDPKLSPLSKSLLGILLSNDIALRKNTKTIYEMIKKGTASMNFSNFRSEVTKPLFELYIPNKTKINFENNFLSTLQSKFKKNVPKKEDQKNQKIDIDKVIKKKEEPLKSERTVIQNEEEFDKEVKRDIMNINHHNQKSHEQEDIQMHPEQKYNLKREDTIMNDVDKDQGKEKAF